MKILFVHNYPLRDGGGGVSVLNFKLACYLRSNGYEAKIFSPQIRESLDFIERDLKKLKKLVLESDVIVLNPAVSLQPPIVKTFYYSKKFNKKYIAWFHIVLDHKVYLSRYQDYEQRFYKLSEILNSENCQKIICVSRVVYEFLKEAVVNQEKIKVIYPGVDTFLKYNFKKNNDLIFAGRFSEEKNIPTLLKAFSYINKKFPAIRLKIVGVGPQEKELKELAKILKLENKIDWISFLPQDDLFKLIAQHKFLINPSIIESLSLITIESLLLGTPVIVSKNPGHLEITQNGRFGLLFNPRDEKDLAEKIIFGLKNYNKLEKTTLEAKKMLRAKFSFEKNWHKYENEILKAVFNSEIYLPKTNLTFSSPFVV